MKKSFTKLIRALPFFTLETWFWYICSSSNKASVLSPQVKLWLQHCNCLANKMWILLIKVDLWNVIKLWHYPRNHLICTVLLPPQLLPHSPTPSFQRQYVSIFVTQCFHWMWGGRSDWYIDIPTGTFLLFNPESTDIIERKAEITTVILLIVTN